MKGPPRPPRELRVVVDTMLQGLGRQLRSCGVDVYVTEAYADHYRTIEVTLQKPILSASMMSLLVLQK